MFASLPAQPQLTVQPRNFAAEDPGDWHALVDLAEAADEAGVDRLIVSDHVAFGEDLDAYGDAKKGGTAGGKQPTGPNGHWLEPLTTLTFLAARTTQVRLGTSILLAALRRPAVLAKTASTLDVLSNGRLDLGVGVGWQAAEYEASGLDFAGRGRLLDHTLEVCQALWNNDSATYESPELSFDAIHQAPKPKQAGGVPIWISGTVNARSMRRLATFGSGWIPWGPAVADPTGGIAAMRAAVSEHGRDPATIAATCYLFPVRDGDDIDMEATMAQAPALAAAGYTDFKVPLPIPEAKAEATEYLGGVVTAFRSATT